MIETEPTRGGVVATAGSRALPVAMVVALVAMVVLLGATILGVGSILSRGGGWGTIILGGVIIAAALVSLAVFGRAGSASSNADSPAPPPTRGTRLLRASYPYLLLLMLASMAVTDTPASLPLVAQPVLRAMTWAALACGVALVARPGLGRSRRRRSALLALSIGWPVVHTATVSVLVSPRIGVQALSWPMSLLAVSGVVTVPTLLVWGALDGLPNSETRAVSLWRLVERRPWFVFAPLALDVVLVVVVLVVGALVNPAEPLIRPGPAWWVFALLIAASLMAVLTLDRLLVVDAADQALIGRIVATLTAVPLALTVLVVYGLPALRVRTLSDSASLLLLAVGLSVALLARLDRPRLPARVLVVGASALGGLVSLVALPMARSGPHPPVGVGSVAQLELVFGLGVLAVLVATVLIAVTARRPRLLAMVAALVGWTALAIVCGAWGSGPTIIPLTIVVIGLLGAAGILWLIARQQTVDGFEIVLTGLVAAPLWLLPALIRLAPDPWARWILMATFLGPGLLVAVRAALTLLSRRSGQPDLRVLALTTLSYAMVAALAWYTGDQAAALADNIASYLLDLFSLPLSVLLILGASARRRAAWSAPDPATAWAPQI